jgi:hypothetical protein
MNSCRKKNKKMPDSSAEENLDYLKQERIVAVFLKKILPFVFLCELCVSAVNVFKDYAVTM